MDKKLLSPYEKHLLLNSFYLNSTRSAFLLCLISLGQFHILLTDLFNIYVKGTVTIVLPLALHDSDFKKIDSVYRNLLHQSEINP
ncbi:hypothetical protein CMALT394_540005 [Carnobacterium maltaromaticum]|nr:hypothetical protein CMALT394_540005 [Carnobacterium maltaromaticum]